MKGPLYEEVLVDFSSEWKVPVKNRTSTDRPFLISFIVFVALWTCIGIYAVSVGDVKILWSDDETDFLDAAIETRGTVLGLIFGSAFICLIYVVLLKWFALPIMIISAMFLTALYGYLAYYFFSRYNYEEDHEDGTTVNHENQTSYLTLSIIFGILAVVVPIIIMCLLEKLQLACQLIQEASSAVMCIYSSLMLLILKVFLHFTAIVYFVVVALHLAAIESLNGTVYWLLMTIHIVGFIWVYCFVTALGEIILASAFATWYWTFDKLKVPSFTIVEGAQRAIRYHLGTVAFGSLLITICRLIRLFLESLKSNGRCGIFFIICARFFMRYVESFLKYMNRNAYIMCALYGKGLYDSASVAMDLIIRNFVRTIALTNIVSWVICTGKILIAALMGLIAMWHYHDNNNEMKYWWVPVWMVIIGTYLVANVFFSIYVIAIDTIYICFLEDCEHHDGTPLKPYYMSRKLRSLLYKEESH